VPIAPALGLMLEHLHYDKYNERFGNDGVHKPLTWEHVQDKIDQFKEEYIFSNIIEREKRTRSMFNWLSQLQTTHHFGIQKECYNGLGMACSLLDKIVIFLL
jgi:tRNA pseudouridine38-40 synthase